jgi:signal transduction histidine kinase
VADHPAGKKYTISIFEKETSMLKKLLIVASFIVAICAFCSLSHAGVTDTDNALAKDSADACAATAKDKPTATQIVEKVKAAADLLTKEGEKAYPKFKGKDSEYIFGGTYIWVHSADGVMLMHPIKPSMVGSNVMTIKDKDGKLFFEEMNKVADASGEGWVEYKWPKPGAEDGAIKVSYVRTATVDGKKVIVGCGVYDLSLEQVKTELKAGK